MFKMKYAAIATMIVLVGCTTTKTVTVVEKQYVAAKVSPALFEMEKPPKPLVRSDFNELTVEGVSVVFGEKIQDLYAYIAKLQNKVITIKKTQDDIANRIENKEFKE